MYNSEAPYETVESLRGRLQRSQAVTAIDVGPGRVVLAVTIENCSTPRFYREGLGGFMPEDGRDRCILRGVPWLLAVEEAKRRWGSSGDAVICEYGFALGVRIRSDGFIPLVMSKSWDEAMRQPFLGVMTIPTASAPNDGAPNL